MLCPFCGKERKDHKRCPKCHKPQRKKWRGAPEPDFVYLFCPNKETVAIPSNDINVVNNPIADTDIPESSRSTVTQMAANWVNWFKTNIHRSNE